jgi:hypothetical protein
MVGKDMKYGKDKGAIAPAGTSRNQGTLRAAVVGLIIISGGLYSPSWVWSQGETTSAIVGQVTDATHAAISGANVAVVNAETGLERHARTDQEGRFTFPQLSPGTYSVKLEAGRV